MSTKKGKRLRITERDFLLANRKASREEEILAHGKPVVFRSLLHKSKKKYDRKQFKKTITQTDDGFLVYFPSIPGLTITALNPRALRMRQRFLRLRVQEPMSEGVRLR